MADIKFRDTAHRDFFLENMMKCRVNDCYHRAFFYVMGIVSETRANINQMFNFKEDCIEPEGMHGGWQTSGTVKVCHLAFNLWNGYAEEGADVHILTSLCDIAWLLNIRGGDIQSVPVVLSYLVLTKDQCIWFLQEEVVDDTIRAYLNENHIETRPYDDIYTYVPDIPESAVVLMNKSGVNYRICNELNKNIQVINKPNPTELMKAVKNPVEVDNTRLAHVKDGVAVTKFMYWLKTNIGKIPMTEISASDYLEARRREQENFIDLSFTTISAYGANAAMMHYSATPESDTVLKPEGFLLVDSGGHYYEGTTDITRTFVLGPISDEMKQHFTAVCRSNMKLANAKFLYGACGLNLDILARGPLWDMGIDYKCGTGHGVGYILNVHEGPNGFRWKIVPERHDSGVLEEGMITTDEPGVYLEGKYGIRTENELVCRKAEKNEYGQFMEFENITYAPIDLDGIDPEQMSPREKQMLNDYHKKVYEVLSPYMTEEENVAEEFHRLKAPVYACLGNHEYYSNQPKVRRFYREASITVAAGTSTPTSITVVATKMSAELEAKRCMASSFSADFILP